MAENLFHEEVVGIGCGRKKKTDIPQTYTYFLLQVSLGKDSYTHI